MNLIKWLYTDSNGEPYQTLFHCANEDFSLIAIMVILLIGVIIQYTRVSWHTYQTAKKYNNSPTKKYLLYFNFVFILCAIAGYGYGILALFVQAYKIRVLILGILFIVTHFFVRYMKESHALQSILELEKDLQGRIDKDITI